MFLSVPQVPKKSTRMTLWKVVDWRFQYILWSFLTFTLFVFVVPLDIEKCLTRGAALTVYPSQLQRLPHTAPRMRVASLRVDRYFTHFDVVRVVKLATCMLEWEQSCTKNDYLR